MCVASSAWKTPVYLCVTDSLVYFLKAPDNLISDIFAVTFNVHDLVFKTFLQNYINVKSLSILKTSAYLKLGCVRVFLTGVFNRFDWPGGGAGGIRGHSACLLRLAQHHLKNRGLGGGETLKGAEADLWKGNNSWRSQCVFRGNCSSQSAVSASPQAVYCTNQPQSYT